MTNDQPHQPLNINIGIIEKDWMLQALNRKNSTASVVQSFWQSWSWLGGHSRNLFYKCLASTPNWICFLHLFTTVQCRASEEIHSLKLHSSQRGPGPDLNDMKCQWKIPNESYPGHRTRSWRVRNLVKNPRHFVGCFGDKDSYRLSIVNESLSVQTTKISPPPTAKCGCWQGDSSRVHANLNSNLRSGAGIWWICRHLWIWYGMMRYDWISCHQSSINSFV